MLAPELDPSPRIARLQRELADANAGAIEQFWQDAADQGTPLIERIPGDDTCMLVTFVWRAREGTQNVLVVSDLAGYLDLRKNQMVHLPSTDLWYKSYRVPGDACFLYYLSPNDSLIAFDDVEDWQVRQATFRVDPLNRHPFQSGTKTWSTVEMPDLRPRRDFAHPEGSRGQVDLHRVHSDILDTDRRVWIYTPAGYAHHAGPYRLVLLFDGATYIDEIPTPVILDSLLAQQAIPPVVTVFVDQSDRMELTCRDAFVDFLADELVPWIARRYSIKTDPTWVTIGGSSLGGLGAAFAAFRRPDVFGNVLSLSGAFWWKPDPMRAERDDEFEWLTRQFVHSATASTRFYVEVGLYESEPSFRIDPSNLLANRHLRDVLQAKGYPVHYAEFWHDHGESAWAGPLADGLRILLGQNRDVNE